MQISFLPKFTLHPTNLLDMIFMNSKVTEITNTALYMKVLKFLSHGWMKRRKKEEGEDKTKFKCIVCITLYRFFEDVFI